MEISELLKANVPAERKKRGWSQEDLANRMGVNQSTVSRIESNGTIGLEDYIKLTEVFGFSLYTLIGRDELKTSVVDEHILQTVLRLKNGEKLLALEIMKVISGHKKNIARKSVR